jgi:hypothetical protein
LVLRWHKGWPSLLLLGMVYGIYEEGLVVRSFYNPGWQDLDNLAVYGRAMGVNWVWTEHLIHFHALVSICISVFLVEIMFPRSRYNLWLSRRTWRLCWAGLILWIPLGFAAFKYDTPPQLLLLSMVSMGALVWLAKHSPTRLFKPHPVAAVPRPCRFWWLGFIGMTFYFMFVYIMADNKTLPYTTTMLILMIWDLLILTLALRWSGNGYAWDDRHKLALVAGGLSLFIMFSFILEGAGSLGMSVVGVLAALGLRKLGKSVREREYITFSNEQPTFIG